MEVSSMSAFVSICLLSLLFQFSDSATVVVDGVSEWRNPSVHIGDSIIFRHKLHYSLYIFQNRGAFDLCNLTQASILTKPDSTSFTWKPSRPGFFYFSFNNGSVRTCQESQKLAIEVTQSSPENFVFSPVEAPGPSSGGVVSSSPTYSGPLQPLEPTSPSPAPAVTLPAASPPVPEKDGGFPFINSNPAIPLPTGEVDSATIRPFPNSGHGKQVVVGFFAVSHMVLCFLVLK